MEGFYSGYQCLQLNERGWPWRFCNVMPLIISIYGIFRDASLPSFRFAIFTEDVEGRLTFEINRLG